MSNRPTPDQPAPGEYDRTIVNKPTESNLENDAIIKDSSNTGEFAATIKNAAAGGSVPSHSKTDLSVESRFGRYEVKRNSVAERWALFTSRWTCSWTAK